MSDARGVAPGDGAHLRRVVDSRRGLLRGPGVRDLDRGLLDFPSLRDGRRLYIDGKVVTDVTDYPPLQGVTGTIAGLQKAHFGLTYGTTFPGDGGDPDLVRAHLTTWLDHYNYTRPHGSLSHKPPGSRLTKAPGNYN